MGQAPDEYEGGRIIGDVEAHYHVAVLVSKTGKWVEDFLVRAGGERFEVIDDRTGVLLLAADTLKEAVRFCMQKYVDRFGRDEIEPVWGAGSPNKVLQELGFKFPEVQ